MHGDFGVVVGTQVPRLAGVAHDSQFPEQTALQQKPCWQFPLSQSVAAEPQLSPFLFFAMHLTLSWQMGVLPPHWQA